MAIFLVRFMEFLMVSQLVSTEGHKGVLEINILVITSIKRYILNFKDRKLEG